MSNKIPFYVIISIFFILNVLNTIQNFKNSQVQKQISKSQTQIYEAQNSILQLQNNAMENIDNIEKILIDQEVNYSSQDEKQHKEIENIKKEMGKSFQKQLEVINSLPKENDVNKEKKNSNIIADLIEKGEQNYIQKEYAESYKLFSDVLVHEPGNNIIREKRAVSLYNMNPMNSTNFVTILNDWEILKENNYYTEELDNIVKIIQMENMTYEE